MPSIQLNHEASIICEIQCFFYVGYAIKKSINNAKIKITRKFNSTAGIRFYEVDPSLVPTMNEFRGFYSAL